MYEAFGCKTQDFLRQTTLLFSMANGDVEKKSREPCLNGTYWCTVITVSLSAAINLGMFSFAFHNPIYRKPVLQGI